MAKDYLNVIERALMMGISDQVNSDVTGDVHVYGQFPETEELKFPAIIVQMTGSGFNEEFFGQSTTFGASGAAGTGEVYGVTYLVHILLEKETSITIGGEVYKQRKLLNWLMLNIANYVADIDWTIYEEEELEVLERHLQAWRDVGYLTEFQWYGATAEFLLHFKNFRT
jgi:hypothetical protein|tara:strand:- start:324 stop:830 length:507 start_codon:yes stop_codon:yes gene_type:complete